MAQKTYCMVAGIIFTLVALFHVLRIFMEWPIMIGDWSVPKSVSWIALIVAGGLALFQRMMNTENKAQMLLDIYAYCSNEVTYAELQTRYRQS
jgi:hypothetical protein